MDTSDIVLQLQTVPAGVLPEALFIEICRLGVLSSVEIVPIRVREGGVQVLLTQREGSDPFWAGMWHNPGTVLRPTDAVGDFSSAHARICQQELGLTTWVEPVFVAPYFWKDARGSVVSLVHYMVQEEYAETETARYFSVDALPDGFISGMEPIIAMAVQAFVSSNK